MEHAEALESIELAAVEPNGLERLMAGDTPDAAAVAGHLAGCPSCVAELARIRRTTTLARQVIAAQPDPALRERTLAFVRALGRDRSAAALAATTVPAPVLPMAIPSPAGVARRSIVVRSRWAWAVAAAIVVVAGAGFAAGGASRAPDLTAREAQIAELQAATQASLRIQGQPDAHRVDLAVAGGYPGGTGTLLFSPASGELVAVASGLKIEAQGEEYGCWVEVDGRRVRIGRMFWAGDLWTWAGPVDGLADLPPGTLFGVSLGPVGGGGSGEPVLTGRL